MIAISDDIPAPTRHNLAGVIKSLEIGQSAYFPTDIATVASVRATVTRIKAESEGSKDYVTARDGDGVRVWRTEPIDLKPAPDAPTRSEAAQ